MSRGTSDYYLFNPLLRSDSKNEGKQEAIQRFCHNVYLLSNTYGLDTLVEIANDEITNKLNASQLLCLKSWLNDQQFQIFIACSAHSVLGNSIASFVGALYQKYQPEQFQHFQMNQDQVAACYDELINRQPSFKQSMDGTGYNYLADDIAAWIDPASIRLPDYFAICCSDMLIFSQACFCNIPLRIAETIHALMSAFYKNSRVESDEYPLALIILYGYFFENNTLFLQQFFKDDGLLKKYFESLLTTLYKLSLFNNEDAKIAKQIYLSLVTLEKPDKNPAGYVNFSDRATELAALFQKNFFRREEGKKADFFTNFNRSRYEYNEALNDSVAQFDLDCRKAYSDYHTFISRAGAPQQEETYRDFNQKSMMSIVYAIHNKKIDKATFDAWQRFCNQENTLVYEGNKKFTNFFKKYLREQKKHTIEADFKFSTDRISNQVMPDAQYNEIINALEACRDQQITEVEERFPNNEFDQRNEGSIPLPVGLYQEDDVVHNMRLIAILQQPNVATLADTPVATPKIISCGRVAAYIGLGFLAFSGLAALGAATAATLGLVHLIWLIPSVYFALGATMTITAGVTALFMNNKRRAKFDNIVENISNKISTLFLRSKIQPSIMLPTPHSRRSGSSNQIAQPVAVGEILPAEAANESGPTQQTNPHVGQLPLVDDANQSSLSRIGTIKVSTL